VEPGTDNPTRRGHDAVSLALLQVAAAAAGGWLILAREARLASALVALAAVAGTAAAMLGGRSAEPRATFAVEAADRAFDAAVLATTAWVGFAAATATASVALVALGTGAVAAYTRARGRGLGFRVEDWTPHRAGRGLLVAAGLFTGSPEAFLWAVVAADAGVIAVRWLRVAAQARAS
jgi:hypothetical protein